ncbi:hypothetical protein K0M31_010743 [Melipona bicolor]|uniref:Uncharacterized protein n=1 Tax=Melipona bicolor TaxID=60889 RepID=A0AA40KHW9_9HYME|nr:hypothetical protein K0M31_010743 [Melipona bicolor]
MKRREDVTLTNKGIEIAAASIRSLSSPSPRGPMYASRTASRSHSHTPARQKTVPDTLATKFFAQTRSFGVLKNKRYLDLDQRLEIDANPRKRTTGAIKIYRKLRYARDTGSG